MAITPKGVRLGGRQKGTPNKVTALVSEMIEEVAEGLGGAERLLAWCNEDKKNESVFWSSVLPKLLPTQITGANGGPVQVEGFKVEIVQSAVPKPE